MPSMLLPCTCADFLEKGTQQGGSGGDNSTQGMAASPGSSVTKPRTVICTLTQHEMEMRRQAATEGRERDRKSRKRKKRTRRSGRRGGLIFFRP